MDEKTNNSRLRQTLLVAAAVLAALVFVVALVRRGVAGGAGAASETPFLLDNSAGQVYAVSDGRLAVAANSGVQLFDADGNTVLHEIVSLSEPGITAGDRRVAAFDIGGTTLLVADFDGNVARVEPAGAIISARMNADGELAVATEAAGYKGMVTVYDEKLTAIYQWYSGTGYVMNAALSDAGTLAVLCADADGASVHLFSLDSEGERGVFQADEELFADLCWLDGGHVAALSQTRLVLLDDRGQSTGEYAFDRLHLYDYSRDGSGFFTLALSQYRSSSATKLVTISPSGEVLGETEPPDGLEGVSACGKQVLVQRGGKLTLYNQQLEELRSAETELHGVGRAILLQRGRALLLSDDSAQVVEL